MTLLRPEALWVLALAAPLALLHLRRVRRQRVEVPSVRLWREVLGATPAGAGLRRFADLWALVLLLLALAALAVGLARPVTGTPPLPAGHLVVAVDVSATMNVRGADGSRFDEARRVVARALAPRASGDDVTLWIAADGPIAEVSPTRRLADVREALARIRPTLTPRSLTATVAAARRALELRGVRATILVVTDAPGAASLAGQDDLVVARVGASQVANAGLQRVALGPGGGVLVDVAITEGGEQARRVELVSGDSIVASEDVALAPSRGVRIRLQAPIGGGLLTVRLVPRDAFPDDDITAVRTVSAEPLRLVVVASGGRPSAFLRAALGALEGDIDGAASLIVSPDVPAEVLASADVVIAEGALPEGLPGDLPVLGFVEEGEIAVRPLLWGASEHPVLEGVDLAPLRIDRAAVRAPGPGERVLIDSASGPVGVVSDTGAARRVILRFRPAASTLPLEPAFPLLVRNALQWLRDSASGPAVVASDAPVPLPDDVARSGEAVFTVGARIQRVPLGPDAAEPPAPTPAPGDDRVLRISGPDGATAASCGLLWTLPPGTRLGTPPDEPTAGLAPDAAIAALPAPAPPSEPVREHTREFAIAAALLLAAGGASAPVRRGGRVGRDPAGEGERR